MRKQVRNILWGLGLALAIFTRPVVVQAEEQEAYDFQLITEERPYHRPEGGFMHPLIIQGNDNGANYTVSLDGEPDMHMHYAIEGELQINPQLVGVQGGVEITGTSSTGEVIVKKYRVTGTYLDGYQIELITDTDTNEKAELELEESELQQEEPKAQTEENIAQVVNQNYEHEHCYVPDYVIKPTKWSDGMEARVCVECGDATDLNGVSSAYVFLQETYRIIEQAESGQTIRLEFGTYDSVPQELIQRIAERNDVTFEIHFLYQNTNYNYTIERGAELDTSASWYGPEKLIQIFHGYEAP